MRELVRVLHLLSRIRWQLRRCWRGLYYGVTNFLILLGGSVLLAAVWYFCFLGWR